MTQKKGNPIVLDKRQNFQKEIVINHLLQLPSKLIQSSDAQVITLLGQCPPQQPTLANRQFDSLEPFVSVNPTLTKL